MLFVVFLGCMIVGIVLMCFLSKREEKGNIDPVLCFLSKREEKGNIDPVHSSFGVMLKYIVAPLMDQRILLLSLLWYI